MGTDTSQVEGKDTSTFKSQADREATPADLIEEVIDIWVVAPAKILWNDYRGRIALLILSVYVLMATVGTVVVPEPSIGQGPQLAQPGDTMAHPLGTDYMGKGLLALMVHGAPVMFKMILSGAVFGGAMGIAIGLLAGYEGGVLDKILMTITDTLGSIPGIPLLLILVAIFEPSNPYLIGIILNIQGWVGGARGIRSQTLAIRKKEYVEASEAMGESKSNILFRDALPELMPMIMMGFLVGATRIINASVGLFFLGVLPYNGENWGVVLREAYEQSGALYSMEGLHWLLVPAVTITGLTVAFMLLSQALDQVFNPRVRARHESRERSRGSGGLDDEVASSENTITQVEMQNK